jgi:hypothetical protein
MPVTGSAVRRGARAWCALSIAYACACSSAAPAAARASTGGSVPALDVTWLSVTNLHLRVGALGILVDGYLSRVPQSTFLAPDLLRTRAASRPDSALVARVLATIGGPGAVNVMLSGHSHFDHAFDTAVWAKLTGAPIYGPRSTCLQALAQDVPASQCTTVQGGERLTLGWGVTVRVVRWNHSGDPAVNPGQHNPSELDRVPTRDPATGGLRAGLVEDFPNGGGSRAYLFTIDTDGGPVTLFFNNTASHVDLHLPIVVDGVSHGAPLDNLRSAMRDARLESVDLWIGAGNEGVARLILPVLRPKAYLPVHWDGLFGAFQAGVPARYADPGTERLLDSAGVRLVAPTQYMDRWRLDVRGVHAVDNGAVRRALGLPLGS